MRVQEETGLLGSYSGGKPRTVLYVIIAAFIAWNILLFILSVVALAKVNNISDDDDGDSTYNYNIETIARDFTVATGQMVAVDNVVSLMPNGNVRLGAGISVFPDIGTIAPGMNANSTNVKVASFDIPFHGGVSLDSSELIVAAYKDNSTGKVYAVVGVMALSYNTLKQWGTRVQVGDMTMLDDLVVMNEQTFAIAGGGKLYVGTMNAETLAITVSAQFTYETTAPNTELARLHYNRLIVAYYKITTIDQSHDMSVALATLTYKPNGAFDTLTWGEAANYTTNKAYHSIFPLSSSSFVVSYPSLAFIPIGGSPNDTLISQLGRVQTDGKIVFGPMAILSTVTPNFFMASVGLSDTHGVVIFIDQASNNALKAVVVGPPTLTGDLTPLDTVAYGSMIHLTNGPASGVYETANGQLIPYIAACRIDKYRFAVAFSDFSNGGRLTTLMAEIDSITNRLSIVTPPFVISGTNPDSAKDYWWVSVAPLVTNSQIGYVVIDSLQERPTDPGRRNNTIVEVAAGPFGFVKSVSGKKSSVVVNGVHKFSDKMFKGLVGRVFYATTQGLLVDDMDTGTQPEAYVVSATGTLVTLTSRVGVAISENEILLNS